LVRVDDKDTEDATRWIFVCARCTKDAEAVEDAKAVAGAEAVEDAKAVAGAKVGAVAEAVDNASVIDDAKAVDATGEMLCDRMRSAIR
jgi:hypothetical protein